MGTEVDGNSGRVGIVGWEQWVSGKGGWMGTVDGWERRVDGNGGWVRKGVGGNRLGVRTYCWRRPLPLTTLNYSRHTHLTPHQWRGVNTTQLLTPTQWRTITTRDHM